MSPDDQPAPESPANAAETAPIAFVAGGRAAPFQIAKRQFKTKPTGRPKKAPGSPPDEHRDKSTYDPAILAEKVAASITEGRGLRRSPRLSDVREEDRRQITRITGESVEIFNERIALNLREIADLASQRIKEKLENNEFKAGELGFILSVAHDKRLSLDGSRALQMSSVNIQVNNFGSSPKESLLADLDGLGNTKQAVPA